MKERFSKARSAFFSRPSRRHRVADLLVFRSPFEGLAPAAQWVGQLKDGKRRGAALWFHIFFASIHTS